jgi:hypothetical protein
MILLMFYANGMEDITVEAQSILCVDNDIVIPRGI